MNFLTGWTRPQNDGWFHVGKASSFPNISEIPDALSCQTSGAEHKSGCRVFKEPQTGSKESEEVSLSDLEGAPTGVGHALKNQVMVFQYRGKFHAIDHECPHSSYPLSNGTPFDIEDFGIVLSAGISCPKHGWSFDLFTGISDRAMYKLTIWQVELRDSKESPGSEADQEVWVRRKPRVG